MRRAKSKPRVIIERRTLGLGQALRRSVPNIFKEERVNNGKDGL
jgi:hypothetical protein